MTTNAALFAANRSHLFGIAYRMLGSKADAEDVLQDAWLRWHEQDATALRSAYFGPWLPEPLADADIATPESHAEFASDLSVAFLAMLERLGPEDAPLSCCTMFSSAITTTSPRPWAGPRQRAGSSCTGHASA